MAINNTPIKNSFIQLSAPDDYGNCDAPYVCLPMLDPTDLSFQLTFLVSGSDLNYLLAYFAAGPYSGQLGPNVLGVIGATLCLDCSNPPVFDLHPSLGEHHPDLLWKCTGYAPTGNTLLGTTEYVLYFQPTGFNEGQMWHNLPVGVCFSICFYKLQYIRTVVSGPFDTVASAVAMDICSETCFVKIADDCDGQPTSILAYANNNDAFGFYYDGLPGLSPDIDFLNTVRLPMYLHSPVYAEDQMTYNKSDGSSQKLNHRIWEDYKFKTDYLTRDQHKALVAATGHDLVFIACPYQGISLGGSPGFQYSQGVSKTQFVRTEKIEVEWQEENIPRFKLGQGKGVLRLAEPSSNTNTNCQ